MCLFFNNVYFWIWTIKANWCILFEHNWNGISIIETIYLLRLTVVFIYLNGARQSEIAVTKIVFTSKSRRTISGLFAWKTYVAQLRSSNRSDTLLFQHHVIPGDTAHELYIQSKFFDKFYFKRTIFDKYAEAFSLQFLIDCQMLYIIHFLIIFWNHTNQNLKAGLLHTWLFDLLRFHF